MAQTVEQALAAASFYSDDQLYALIRLPPAAITVAAGIVAQIGEPFCTLVVDKDEVTLLIPAQAADDFAVLLNAAERAPTDYRLITIDVPLEPSLVGFMARISAALAAAQVSILPIAAYARDHLMVPANQFETARTALEKLKAGRP